MHHCSIYLGLLHNVNGALQIVVVVVIIIIIVAI